MKVRWWVVVALMVVGCTPAAGQAAEWADLQATEPVGWYEVGDHKALVTWAPTGDDLRFLDFEAVEFAALERDASGDTLGNPVFLWSAGDRPDRRVTFVRDRDGHVQGFRWRDDAGGVGFYERAEQYPFDQARVRFESQAVEMVGLLMLPRVRRFEGAGGSELTEVDVTVPGAVFIHGSGSSDRDNVWAFHIAQHLARAGVAVLFPDKRGSGASGGDWRTADFETLAADALAAATVLRDRAEVDGRRVGFVGLSQGGWVAPLAAARGNAAFVIDVSGSAVTPGEQVRHEVAQDLRSAGLDDNGATAVLALLDRAHVYSRTLADTAWSAYVSARNALLDSPLADAVAPFPADREDWQWAWWHEVVDFDPLPLWRRLEIPALVVYGADDEADNVPVAVSVERLEEALTPHRDPTRSIRVFEGSGHALTDPEAGWIRSDFLALLTDWLAVHVGGAGARGG